MTVSVNDIDALLPQTQCGECHFSGCRPYAEAMAQGIAPIDRCPPGGVETVRALAQLLHIDPEPLLAAAIANTRPPALASIREEECIGCTKCITACPVDAIVGSGKLMHAIIPTECTGCGLCVEPCPVDCIELLPLESPGYDKTLARSRFEARKVRQLRKQQEQEQAYRDKRQLVQVSEQDSLDKIAKQDYILQALARVRAKKI